MSGKNKTLLQMASERLLLMAQIELLQKLHDPQFSKDLKALLSKYSKKPNVFKNLLG